ncbi:MULTISPECIES: hypothetical protein [Halomonadaceae]|uniref:Organic solvent ABC transporter permease n=1 Tax=Vreelandella halophila TaxID=86177 RepID=A0A9X4YCZ6_9GAMM|nr:MULTISPECIES: hypothetical protein [Halomonas]MYL27377.1 hypothetical protein [Halomonas utahensis]MYL74503.1 hypothetical protein [Halomonas sp. 22501_18_FS]
MTTQTPRNAVRMVTAFLTTGCLLALAGCGGSDGDGDGDLRTGTLFTEGVENIHYETRSQSGTTGENGEFRYHPGETLTFRLGNLVLAENVPAAPFLTPIDFTAEARRQLHSGGTDGEGLETHRGIEEDLAENNAIAINITRLLSALAEQDSPASSEETLEITQRTIDQLNSYLADDSNPRIDFSVSTESFSRPDNISEDNREDDTGDLIDPSPANRLLDSICFAPEGDELCEAPPTESEIGNATGDRVEELEDERRNILNARRTLDRAPTGNTIEFLSQDTLDFRNDLATAFYLEPGTLTIGPSDGSIRTVAIKRTGSSGFSLKRLEAKAEGSGWAIHSVDRQEGTVEFYRNTSRPAESGTILVNFKVDYPGFDNYRWVRKNLLVEVN